MKQIPFLVASILLSLLMATQPGFSNSLKSESDNSKKIQKSKNSGGIITEGFLNDGAWDWSNWQDVVAECRIFVFRKRMISSK